MLLLLLYIILSILAIDFLISVYDVYLISKNKNKEHGYRFIDVD
jgi:hypothetical protein